MAPSEQLGYYMQTAQIPAEEAEFEALFAEWEKGSTVDEGTIVEGTVLSVGKDFIVVDISYKSEGQIQTSEFTEHDGTVTVLPGDVVEVYVERRENDAGLVELSKEKADRLKIWDEIAEACENEELVEGVITGRVKGGLTVDIGVKAFLPGSQVDLRPVRNLEKYIGQRFHFKVIKFNKRRGNIVLSRRALLEKQREALKAQTLAKLQEGMLIDGVVKNITDYGAFIDLGGIDGLLHITDMTYGRITHPSEMVEVGQEVEVKVLKFDEDSQRVSLGSKQIRPDPWDEVDLRYPPGAIVRGKVVSMPDYGCFIELEDGIEGLVHISEMTWNKRVKHPSKLVEMGSLVEAKVLGVDVENKRISLGMRQLEANPWDVVEEKYPVGTIITGAVRNITDFGIFVGIEEGIDGLVHISDLSWSQRIKHPSEVYNKGDEVEARVLNIDRDNERFSLGIKQLSDDPWLSVQSRYFLGQVIKGTVVSRTDFGVFVEIEQGVEGLVHMSELNNPEGDWAELYPDQQEMFVEVRRVDPHDRKLSLAEVTAEDMAADAAQGGETAGDFIARQTENSNARLGDVLGDLSAKLGVADTTNETAEEAPAEDAEVAAEE